MPLRRPRKIAIKDKKLLVRVSPPRGGFTEEERDSVLGVRLTLSTKSWQWTRQFIFSSDGVFQRKFPLMDIVYDRDDLLRQMIGKTITLTASFLDKYSEYSQGEEATKTLKLDNGEWSVGHIVWYPGCAIVSCNVILYAGGTSMQRLFI